MKIRTIISENAKIVNEKKIIETFFYVKKSVFVIKKNVYFLLSLLRHAKILKGNDFINSLYF